MSVDLLIDMAWKSALCAGAALLLLRVMRGRSAAQRSLIGHLGIVSILLLPVGAAFMPTFEIAAPRAISDAMPATPMDATAAPETPVPVPSGPVETGPDWAMLLLTGYGLVAAALLLLAAAAVARLHMMRRRSEVLVDPHWLTALAAAQRRLGLKHGTALLTSDALRSPISWGVVRPVIIVDGAAARESDRAEAIIAHELAHVARLDWLALLCGRLATALFWFNPLVWMLARSAHELSEQAADDVVIRAEIPSHDYAEILVGAARNANGRLALAANGVAPGAHSLARRVLNILDPARSRAPVRLGWALTCLALSLGVGTALAAVQPVVRAEAQRGDFGEESAARLAAIDSPQTRAISAAIRAQDWDKRRSEGSTRFDQAEAVEPLVMALRDKKPVTRRIAVWGLSEMRPKGAAAPVGNLLDDESPEVRGEAARALGELGAVDRSPALARLLQDPDAGVRRQAAHALGDLQDPASRPALEAALRDSDPAVRAKAAWALGQVTDAEAVLRRYRN